MFNNRNSTYATKSEDNLLNLQIVKKKKAMVTTIKRGATKTEIESLFEKLINSSSKNKGFDAHKFCGTVKFNEDAMEIQKRLRDEWK